MYKSILLSLGLIVPVLDVFSQETSSEDILFLKIQELEEEIAFLRSELESQSYMIEKLIDESVDESDSYSSSEQISANDTFRFDGINDAESIDQIYEKGINALNEGNYGLASEQFTYLKDKFADDEKIPLSLFWLGEIAISEMSLDEAKENFTMLVNEYPLHWRTPLAHKKLGDILLAQDKTELAKAKYQFVINTYPDNAASPLALQILENME